MHELSGDIRALLRGEGPVPMLALDHRKLLLLLKLGRCWNKWWNSPTGHLCDKWIKLDKVMLAAIGFYLLVKSEPHGTGPSFIFIISSCQVTHDIMKIDICHLDIRFLSNNWNELEKKQTVWITEQTRFMKATIDQRHVPFFLIQFINQNKTLYFFVFCFYFFQEQDGMHDTASLLYWHINRTEWGKPRPVR